MSFVTNKLTVDKIDKSIIFQRFTVVNVPGVIIKLKNSPHSLQIRCSLNPKSHPMEHLPLWIIPLNVLLM